MAVRWAFVQLGRFLPPTITSLVPANVLLRTCNSGSITGMVVKMKKMRGAEITFLMESRYT